MDRVEVFGKRLEDGNDSTPPPYLVLEVANILDYVPIATQDERISVLKICIRSTDDDVPADQPLSLVRLRLELHRLGRSDEERLRRHVYRLSEDSSAFTVVHFGARTRQDDLNALVSEESSVLADHGVHDGLIHLHRLRCRSGVCGVRFVGVGMIVLHHRPATFVVRSHSVRIRVGHDGFSLRSCRST